MKPVMRTLLWMSAMFLFAGGLFSPVYAVFVEEIGGDLTVAGSAQGLYMLIAGILIFFISKWEDHVKHKEKLIISGYALSVLGYGLLIFVQAPIHLYAVQVFFGVGTAISAPAYDGMFSKSLQKGKFVSQWGAWESMARIVTAVAATTGGYIAQIYGFRALFIIMLGLSISGLLVSSLLLRR
jgi:MFS family permease